MRILLPDEYYALKLWCWNQVNTDGTEDYYKAITDSHDSAWECTVLNELVPFDELSKFKVLGERVGAIDKTLFAFEAFVYNYETMRTRFAPFKDRMIPYRPETREDDYMVANAMYQNIITSGKRLIKAQEDSIIHCFSKVSKHYREWHEFTAFLYDHFQSYRFFYQIRNSIEHYYTTFELVSFNEELGTMGFAVNLEHESLDELFPKSEVRREFKEFAESETRAGRHPWLSVTKIFEEFRILMNILREHFLHIVLDSIDQELVDGIPDAYDSVVKLTQGDSGQRNFHRLYRIPQKSELLMLNNYEQTMLGVVEKTLVRNAVLMDKLKEVVNEDDNT